MKFLRLVVCGLLLSRSVAPAAEQVLQKLDWAALDSQGLLQADATLLSSNNPAVLEIANRSPALKTIPVLKLTNPPITAPVYALRGELRHEFISAVGYLELWNYFPPAREGVPPSQYFSRTLADSGDMGKLTGSSDWRRFNLPFDSAGAAASPLLLEWNVILPAGSSVMLRNVELVQFGESRRGDAGRASQAWWTDRQAGILGGTAGAVIGCLGGLIGSLAARGKARLFVIGGSLVLIVLGGLNLVACLLALGLQQPFHVWFPPLLLGLLLVAILPVRLRQYLAMYQQRELRRMQSLDVLGR